MSSILMVVWIEIKFFEHRTRLRQFSGWTMCGFAPDWGHANPIVRIILFSQTASSHWSAYFENKLTMLFVINTIVAWVRKSFLVPQILPKVHCWCLTGNRSPKLVTDWYIHNPQRIADREVTLVSFPASICLKVAFAGIINLTAWLGIVLNWQHPCCCYFCGWNMRGKKAQDWGQRLGSSSLPRLPCPRLF